MSAAVAPHLFPEAPAAPGRPEPTRLPARRARRNPLLRALLVITPVALLLTSYLVLCTAAVRTGQHRHQLQGQIAAGQDRIDVLQAEVRELQSPARILADAERLGMQRPTEVAFTQAPRAPAAAAQLAAERPTPNAEFRTRE